MLRSCSISNDKIEIFQLFIHRLLDGNTDYKESIDRILEEAYRFTKGETNIYSIDRTNFDIILKLSKIASKLLNELDIKNINNNDYQNILNSFESNPSLVEN